MLVVRHTAMLRAAPHTHLLDGIDQVPGVLIGQRVPMTAS
jgi:hypothetical protein